MYWCVAPGVILNIIWTCGAPTQEWKQVYPMGALTKFYNDTYFGKSISVTGASGGATYVPITNSTSRFAGTC